MFAVRLGIERAEVAHETRNIEVLDFKARQVDRRTVLLSIPFDAIGCFTEAFRFVQAIPAAQIQLGEFAIFGDLLFAYPTVAISIATAAKPAFHLDIGIGFADFARAVRARNSPHNIFPDHFRHQPNECSTRSALLATSRNSAR